ncbi:RNA polymerase sigma factor [Streptomyces sp. NPDC021093]|uniref:RNA polymerase sigma factor n=1 Tax=Streptomyces sp. NPDC021093 TaxID=3365112 RepID=UPI00379927B2
MDTDTEAEVEVDAGSDLTAAVECARGGDQDGFSALFRLVQPKLLGYLRTMVGEEAEDVAADAWLQISRDIGEFRGDGPAFRGWVRAVARNRAIDHLRRVRSRPQGVSWEVCGVEVAPLVRDSAEVVMDSLATACVMSLIRQLPVDQGEAVLLRVLVGLDSPEAGRVLGKQAGAVRMAAHRGLRGLAGQLDSACGVAAAAA